MTISGIGSRALNLAPVNANSNAAPATATAEPADGFIAAPSGGVKMSWNPQDGTVMEPGSYTINNLNADISTSKLKLNGTATPAADGSYVVSKDSPDFTKLVAFAAAANTVDIFSKAYGDKNWAFGPDKLKINADVSEQFNANYQRGDHSVNFYHAQDPVTGAMVYSGRSGEVVAHEVGHAILDSLRPEYHNTWSAEPKAFHESFGDVMGMLMTLQNDESVDALVKDTGGDLSKKANLLSDTGEGFGKALGMKGALRTAFNSLVYADPATLPSQGDDTHLGHEVHDLSRLWSGTFYDVLTGINAANMAAGMDPKASLKSAGEEAFKLVVGQIEHSNNGSETTFKEMGQNLLASDQEHNGGKRADIIKNVLVKRGLMDANAPVASFAPAQRAFTGETTQQTLSFGPEMGILNGVKMDVTVPQASSFGLLAGGGGIDVAAEATKGASLLAQDGKILFTDHVPTLGEIFQPDGSAITTYVMPNANGERQLFRVPLA